jgi:hypothetical protein
MSDLEVLSRRAFVARSRAWPLAALLLPAFRLPLLLPESSGGLQSDLATAFGSRECRRALGRAYLDGTPREASREVLLQEIVKGDVLSHRDLSGREPRVLRHLLEQQIRHDFRQGRLASVDGWQLSVTEARLCALAWLL